MKNIFNLKIFSEEIKTMTVRPFYVRAASGHGARTLRQSTRSVVTLANPEFVPSVRCELSQLECDVG